LTTKIWRHIIPNILNNKIPRFFNLKSEELIRDIIDLLLKYDHVAINTNENHYKFWAYNDTGISFWGRIDSPNPRSLEGDISDFQIKIYKKLMSGYQSVAWTWTI